MMRRIFWVQAIEIQHSFQSRWTNLNQPFGYSGLPIAGPLSWAGESLYGQSREREFSPNRTEEMAESLSAYWTAIERHMALTDDIALPGDDLRRLYIGVHFPKTRHGVMMRLQSFKAEPMFTRSMFESAEEREAQVHRLFKLRRTVRN